MTTLPTDALVVDIIEAKVRTLMARRAGLPDAWPHRGERAELSVEIDACLERLNWLVLGR
jgi:hypothetical protein